MRVDTNSQPVETEGREKAPGEGRVGPVVQRILGSELLKNSLKGSESSEGLLKA